MKFIRLHVENFRLLRKVTLNFAISTNQNITLIRAANDSGKTTLLTALQWGLYGYRVLPDQGRAYRMSPMNTESEYYEPKREITVKVEVDFEVPTRIGHTKYKLIRQVDEVVDGETWKRGHEVFSLFDLTSGGDKIENPTAYLASYLPIDLREVFFTDGDRALNFIEGKSDDQSMKVERAIASILGIELVEKAKQHIVAQRRELNKKIRDDEDVNDDLKLISNSIAENLVQEPTYEQEIENLEQHVSRLKKDAERFDNELTDALRSGNREQLNTDLSEAKKRRDVAERQMQTATLEHTKLFRSKNLVKLLDRRLAEANTILESLHRKGDIPRQTIPVLQDCIDSSTCICGESLSEADTESLQRRRVVESLIDSNRDSDETKKRLTELHYRAQFKSMTDATWVDEYCVVSQRFMDANKQFIDANNSISEFDAQIKDLPDVNITQLRESRNLCITQAEEQTANLATKKFELNRIREKNQELQKKQKELLDSNKKDKEIRTQFDIAEDLESLLDGTLKRIKKQELKKVSEKMDKLFKNMIGAEPTEQAIIWGARITPDYKIIVKGPRGSEMTPSIDINGASLRALTVAFILALTEVSEVQAPNVIDTPLGMMSGHVKRGSLEIASKHSAQLLLMLQYDEIKGCEKILDEYVGKAYTFTNPAYYPKALVNKPKDDASGIQVCECNHRGSCLVCQRVVTTEE